MTHKRSLATYATAPFQSRHYVAFANIWSRACEPVEFLRRYLLRDGSYPHVLHVRTPANPRLPITIYSGEDVQTINEIFCRGDYEVAGDEKVVVDFGSNIGISALYWLNFAPQSFLYLFEPLARNVERLRAQLKGHEERYELHEVAVGTADGEVEFGYEPSGRYGGIGRTHMPTIKVPAVDSNAVLARVIEKHGRIDILKIDIETMEKVVTERIPEELADRIGTLFVEYPFTSNPLDDTHNMQVNGDISLFRLRRP
jgi:FkbM family methyltransferase